MFTHARLRLLLLRACSAALLCFAISAPLTAQTNHLVHIGLGGGQLAFTDADSGTSTTVVQPGDTVTWEWDYIGIQHTTSSGLCTPTVPGICTLNGIWDSGFRFNPPPPPNFTRQFNDLGTFPYFCQVHGPDFGMRGKVVVLNGPDYELDINNNSNPFQPPPIPTITTLAGQTVRFSGQLFGFLGYNNLVNLSCMNGSPRNPDNCPPQSATPSPSGTAFNFSVGDSTAGNYTFNITGTGTDPANLTHSQQVMLSVTDLGLTSPSQNPVTVVSTQNSVPIKFQVASLNNFSGSVNLSCSGLPVGASCNFNPSFPFISPGLPVQNVTLTIFTGSATVGIYPLQIVASSNFAGTFFSRSQNLTLRLVPADHFSVQVLPGTKVTAGTPFSIVVTALDGMGNPVQNYADTIHFSSSDSSISAALPADYKFTGQGNGNDNGTHTFNITLIKVEPLTITATDSSFNSLAVTTPSINVVPADRLSLQVPTNVTAGTPFNLVVTALDGAGNPAQIYADTIHFTSSDPAILAQLPDYSFTGQGMGNDNGTHTFSLTLTKIEPVTITITDISFPGLVAVTPVILVKNGSFDGMVTVASSRNGNAPPHFATGAKASANGSVTFTATVTLNSGDPAGNVRFFDGSNELGLKPLSAAVSGTATASLTLDGMTQQLRPSDHIITAVYEPTAGTGNLAVISQPRSPAPRCDNTRCP